MKPAIESAADAGGVVGPDVVAACALSAIPGVGATAMARITQMFGGFSGAMEAGPAKIAAAAVALQLKQEAVDYLVRKPDLEELGLWAVAAAKGAGARICVLGDPWYPPLLRGIDNPPPVLYVRGQLEPDSLRVALVGARDSDDYGLELARDIAEGLALAGVQVVSGGARAGSTRRRTRARSGARAPPSRSSAAASISSTRRRTRPSSIASRAAAGAVVSEFPPGTGPDKRNFPRRNRTLSGLSAATVVIRASVGSGSLITANHAAQQGRPIFAVPGSTDEPLSAGPNSLLTKDAARAVTSARDILMSLGWPIPAALNTRAPVKRKKARSLAPQPPSAKTNLEDVHLSEEERRLYEALDDRAPQHADELATKTGIPVAVALSKLSELELKGLATQRPGKYFLRRTA